MKPITGSVNEKGLFTAKNPYDGNYSPDQYDDFALEHPKLFCYTTSNVLVTDEEHLEVKPWCRYNSPDTEWTLCSGNTAIFKKSCGYEVEHCYITIPPTELTDAKPFKAVYEPEAQPLERVKTVEAEKITSQQYKYLEPEQKDRYTRFSGEKEVYYQLNLLKPINNNPHMESIREAANRIRPDTLANWSPETLYNVGFTDGAEWAMSKENAQFATDAGGGNVPICLRNLSMEKQYWLNISNGIKHNNTVIVDTFFADNDEISADFFHSKETNVKRLSSNATELFLRMIRNGFRVIFLDDSAKRVVQKLSPPIYDKHYADALSTPSTHSSSEMVEVEKVVRLISEWYQSSEYRIAPLITQIRTKK